MRVLCYMPSILWNIITYMYIYTLSLSPIPSLHCLFHLLQFLISQFFETFRFHEKYHFFKEFCFMFCFRAKAITLKRYTWTFICKTIFASIKNYSAHFISYGLSHFLWCFMQAWCTVTSIAGKMHIRNHLL